MCDEYVMQVTAHYIIGITFPLQEMHHFTALQQSVVALEDRLAQRDRDMKRLVDDRRANAFRRSALDAADPVLLEQYEREATYWKDVAGPSPFLTSLHS